jgi:hypothetical protein
MSVLFPHLVLPFEHGTISPLFDAVPVLLVFKPFTIVFSSVRVDVDAFSVRFVV